MWDNFQILGKMSVAMDRLNIGVKDTVINAADSFKKKGSEWSLPVELLKSIVCKVSNTSSGEKIWKVNWETCFIRNMETFLVVTHPEWTLLNKCPALEKSSELGQPPSVQWSDGHWIKYVNVEIK